MKRSNSLLTFHGQCLEAFECYAEIFGGSVASVKLQRDLPSTVEHAVLRVGSWTLTGRDTSELEALDGGAVALLLCSIDADDALKLYYALATGGQTTTPMHEARWAKLAGGLVDRFGTAWIICHGVRHSSPRLLADSPQLSFDVLPLDPGLHDNGYRAYQRLSEELV